MPKPSTILGAMKAELARSQQAFKTERVQPYFLSYEITDDQVVNVTGHVWKTPDQPAEPQPPVGYRPARGNSPFGQHPWVA